jgi:hypothetical protein
MELRKPAPGAELDSLRGFSDIGLVKVETCK